MRFVHSSMIRTTCAILAPQAPFTCFIQRKGAASLLPSSGKCISPGQARLMTTSGIFRTT